MFHTKRSWSEKSSSFNKHSLLAILFCKSVYNPCVLQCGTFMSRRLPFHFATILGFEGTFRAACSQVLLYIRAVIVFLLDDHLQVLMPGASIVSRKSEVARRRVT